MAVYDFTHAILRRPGASVVDGLRDGGGPSPSFAGVVAEHDGYARALAEAGVSVEVLPALEAFPDSVFVEDPALVFPSGAVLLRPGAPTRAGEAGHLAGPLARHFGGAVAALAEGHADGGDVMVLPGEVLIGMSARTDAAGAEALSRALDRLGHRARIVDPPPGALHLKTVAALINEETVLATRACADAGTFPGLRVLIVPEGEEPAANALRVNRVVLVGDRFPRTVELLERHGCAPVPLPTREIGRLDAGLSCMSLRWRAN